ncbi:MAG: RsmE family RNA methyltransferase [Xanthomonadales bacterium]|nr:RsmE family RNA methyltransferase [Xanthomonadales bacterium]
MGRLRRARALSARDLVANRLAADLQPADLRSGPGNLESVVAHAPHRRRHGNVARALRADADVREAANQQGSRQIQRQRNCEAPKIESPLPLERAARLLAEGGFSDRDLAVLEQARFQRITLGPRILRTETAGLAAIAALQTRFGDLG